MDNQKIAEALDKAGHAPDCPACKSIQTRTGFVELMDIDEKGKRKGNASALLAITCRQCASVRLFDAMQLGLVTE
jgi:hypothetical protein